MVPNQSDKTVSDQADTLSSFYATIWGVVLLDVVDMTLVKLCRLLFGNAPLLIVAAFRIIGIPH